MPIPSSDSIHSIIRRPAPTLDRVDDENEEEDELDDDELLTTPTTSEDRITQHVTPLLHPPHPSIGQRLLSSSLPPSLTRRKTSPCGGDKLVHHENPLDELLRLTQPMREGVMAREKLLPPSRMKQVGIGGRGRRSYSKPTLGSSSPLANHHMPLIDSNENDLPAPASIDQTLSPIRPSNALPHSTLGLGTLNPSSAHQTPLLRPRPIVAWQKPES